MIPIGTAALDSSWARRLAVLVLALGVACERPVPPPQESQGFSLTDKFFDVKALGNDSFLLLGYRSKLARSDDAGVTWRMIEPPTHRNLTRLSFVDGKHGWAVGHEGLIYATDSRGDSWTPQQSGTPLSLFDVDFVSVERGFAVGDLSTVVDTTDGGRSWRARKVAMSTIGVTEDMSLAITDPIFYGVDFIDEKTGWVVGEFGQIRSTRDGGETWEAQHGSLLQGKFRIYRDIMALPTLLCVRFRDTQHGIAIGTYGAIVSTDDGGKTWRFNESPVSVPLYRLRLLPDGDAVIVGASGAILRGNPENGWRPAQAPPGVFTWMSGVDFDDSGHGVAGGGHGLVVTSADFGKTWEWRSNG